MRIARFFTLLVVGVTLGACRATTPSTIAGSTVPDSVQVRLDIETLASDALEGRRTGTPGNDSAAMYLARRYAAPRPLPSQNIAGLVRGSDPAPSGWPAHVGDLESVVNELPGTPPVIVAYSWGALPIEATGGLRGPFPAALALVDPAPASRAYRSSAEARGW